MEIAFVPPERGLPARVSVRFWDGGEEYLYGQTISPQMLDARPLHEAIDEVVLEMLRHHERLLNVRGG